MAGAREKLDFRRLLGWWKMVSEMACYIEEIKLSLDCSIKNCWFQILQGQWP